MLIQNSTCKKLTLRQINDLLDICKASRSSGSKIAGNVNVADFAKFLKLKFEFIGAGGGGDGAHEKRTLRTPARKLMQLGVPHSPHS